MSFKEIFILEKGGLFILPALHHTMELAGQVKMAFQKVNPDCVAVELPETLHEIFLQAASRLPDISVIKTSNAEENPLYFLCEPCDPFFEALRCALEGGINARCIDLDVAHYPEIREHVPDPYVIQRIGLRHYYGAYKKIALHPGYVISKEDNERELYMAKRLKELSFSFDRILFVTGMAHAERIAEYFNLSSFPQLQHVNRSHISLCSLSEKSCREVLPEFGWIAKEYELARKDYMKAMEISSSSVLSNISTFPPDRQKLLFNLYKEAGEAYKTSTGNLFQGYHLKNTMKFGRNYALITDKLMPDLYQLLCAAKGCVDHNYAYEVWELATAYPFLRNIDNLPILDLTIEEIWGNKKLIRFHRKEKSRKAFNFQKRRKDRSTIRFEPPGPFTLCSYPKEDVVIENFGEFLKKKGVQLATQEGTQTAPFTTSLEDGLDTRETIRHWHEKKIYVKIRGKPPGRASSIVVIFDEDTQHEGKVYNEKYTWKATWIGEHSQESDMALYATDIKQNIVGPGISRCEYGGFMLTSPPRRLMDVWSDQDYTACRTKAEVLLASAIDYATEPIIVYVAEKPPRSFWKSHASRFGKKIIYLPIGQLSPIMLNKIRVFHVLDSQDKRQIADEYIF